MAKFKFKRLGVMIDMSRNSVMSVEGLKRYLPLLKKMGYNTVMLYTEDTYEVEGEPYMGYMRGRYSIADMKQIDAYAASLGIEMIPCVQTLAHLNAYFRWLQLPKDIDDILLVDDDRTYEFIDHMFATLSQCFASRHIHIGMDEAHHLGRGSFLDKHGYEKSSAIIARHLARVNEIAAKYGYRPMLWSDMFFRSWNRGGYYIPEKQFPKEIVDNFPKNVDPVYWDYYSRDEKHYDAMLKNHAQLPGETWFAGGLYCWSGLIPFNEKSLLTMRPAIDACRANKTGNIFFTMWGDDGGECSHFAQLPCLLYLAEYAKGNTDENLIKAKFKRLTGIDYDDFVKIDIPNDIDEPILFNNPSKYMLYSDPFNGYLDYTVDEKAAELYPGYAAQLYAVAKKSRKYGYLFDTAAKLCDVLTYKYALGVKTREAYRKGDRQALQKLASEDYIMVEKRVKLFHDAFEKQWLYENNPCGFDIQDIRLGGLLQRVISCRKRLNDYLAGRVASIPELENELLPIPKKEAGKTSAFNCYARTASSNVFSHG